jgi:hypothetical protein
MKKFSRDELNENAQRLMKAHGKREIFATQDGNFFFQQSDAVNQKNKINQENGETYASEVIAFDAVEEKEVKVTKEEKPAKEVKVTKEEKPAKEVKVTKEEKPAKEVKVTKEEKPAKEVKASEAAGK